MAKADKQRLSQIAEHLLEMRNAREQLKMDLSQLPSTASNDELKRIYSRYINKIEYYITMAEECIPDNGRADLTQEEIGDEESKYRRLRKNESTGTVDKFDYDEEVDIQTADKYYDGRG